MNAVDLFSILSSPCMSQSVGVFVSQTLRIGLSITLLTATMGAIAPRVAWAGKPGAFIPAPTTTAVQDPLHISYLQISLSNREVTLFQDDTPVRTYPVAVGRDEWPTPVGSFEVQDMTPNPEWRNPFTGEVIAGGDPENPLGYYWIGFWTDGTNWVGMHGTPNRDSVGQAASHGCIRLYNEDIQEIYSLVTVGTPVVVVP
jgi:lipoprotein-anchoring transpeptidase ErfK/SrfK